MSLNKEIAYNYAYRKTLEFIKINKLEIKNIEIILDFFIEGYNQILFKLNEKE